ncbi:MAG TPA: BtrH N-terminal domain-containing protein [Pilimelia sp.]|nr:BtrH N-terminal domain-containing protein [Pilimelia sp.]
MTERKTFKKIVRSRMERTGESYTTAHRHVSGRRPGGLPAGLVPGYDSFGRSQHHESALVRRLLGQAGLRLSEPMTCGLGGGIGFLYAVFEYAGVTTPLLTIVAQHHPQPWAPAALDRLGVAYTELHATKPAAALTKLRRALDGGRPALCTVNRAGLPWHGDVSPMAAADPYAVVVAGADGDTLYVDDLAPEPHEIDAADFGAAWAGHRKGRHHMLTVDTAPDAVDLPAAGRDAIATTIAHLTGPVLGNSFDVNFGFSGMEKLAAELRDPRGKHGWERRFGTAAGFNHAMVRLEACLEREYTAPGATRPLYADYLDEAASVLGARAATQVAGVLGASAATQAAALFRESGRRWSRLAALAAAQAGTPGGPDATRRRELFDEFATLVESCLTDEREAVEVLRGLA